MQPPLAVATSEPDNKIFYLCLPGAEFQVGLPNLVGSVATDLKIDGFERDIGQPKCVRGRTPKFLYRFPPGNDRRIGWQNIGIVGVEPRHAGIVLAGRSRAKFAISLIDGVAHRSGVHGSPPGPAMFSCTRSRTAPELCQERLSFTVAAATA